MDPTSDTLSELTHRIDSLEERVSHLEHLPESPAAARVHEPIRLDIHAEATSAGLWSEAASTFGVLGRAMLGIAGGYVVRAVAESGSLPKFVVAVAAILYAALWLLAAARTRGGSSFATAVYAGTSALLLAPMLWEMTLRFDILSPAHSAIVIATFLLCAYLLAWHKRLTALVLMAECSVIVMSLALIGGTRDLLPFLCVILLAAFLNEWAAIREQWTRLRFIPALGANLVLLLLYSIYSRPESSRTDFANLSVPSMVAPACTLLGIYAASVVIRTMIKGKTIRIFEIVQTTIAFLLAAATIIQFGPAAGAVAFGAACMVLSVASYTLTLRGRPSTTNGRNAFVYSAWGLGLLLFGGFVVLSGAWPALLFGAAATFFTTIAPRINRLSLGYHGLLYLLAAAFACGLFASASATFAGSAASPPPVIGWLICAAAMVCYAAMWRIEADKWQGQVLRLGSAALAVSSFTIAFIWAIIWAARSVAGTPAWHLAVIRTFAGCLISVALAFAGPHLHRRELAWLSYATLALLAIKLVTEDLRHGHAEFSAASIFLVATTVILVPRIVRNTSAAPASAPAKTS